ncbi:MAG TPA: class I SAM-dependent methyltransferase [Anaerolineae bacterium]|nr:class I SAM-dependent methyltransferase [Anaerolineae bacterium]
MPTLLFVAALAAVALVAYWQLIVAEGAYLGPRVVAFLYDVIAHRYNRIKQFNPGDDAHFFADPLIEWLVGTPRPRVLDVATGTGRVPLTLVADPAFDGTVVAVDLSRRMLREAARALNSHSRCVFLSRQDGSRLAFGDDAFDAVSCLEALEFMPNPRAALTECVRVLKPGGVLMVTRRAGSWARWMPGRAPSREQFKAQVEALGVWSVQVQTWQVDYDLVWGVKIAQWSGKVIGD